MLKYDVIEITPKFNREVERFIKLGYKCELRKSFIVKIKDLNINSTIKVECICEICNKNTKESYSRYLINKNNHYYSCSSKCSTKKRELTNLKRYGHKNSAHGKKAKEKTKKTLIKRYGVDSPLKSKEIRDKFSKTMEDMYGSSHALQNKDTKNKAESTTLDRYGVKNSFQSNIIKDKIKETNLGRYGHENSAHGKEAKQKIKDTLLEKYGVDNAMKSEEILEKVRLTNLERYGTEYPLQNKEIYAKLKSTNLEKYGTEYAFQSYEVKEYIKNTIIEKYDVEYYTQSEVFKEKAKETMLERYGVDNPMKSEVFKEKAKDTSLEKYGVEYYTQSDEYKYILLEKQRNVIIDLGIKPEDIIDLDGDFININCHICNTEYRASNYFIYQRLKYSKTEPCTKCNPVNINGQSGAELNVLQFIKDNYEGEILTSNRKILSGKELDIYLPDLGLAFEYNGLYWHSELYKESSYHLKKTEDCLEENVYLIHIYEDDWNYKQDIVKSRILNLLSKSNKIFARKCTIKEVDYKDSKLFLENNHIQGNVNSKIILGLYYKVSGTETDELVSLMTFGSLRKNLGQVSKEGSYELLRFCNKLNTTVVGGASRLFKYFKLNYLPKEVISYADRSWSKGGLYENLGFTFIKNTGVNYYYVVEGIRKNRFGYRKDVLVKEGYDSLLTEHDIMMSRGFYRIYDSGSIKYIWK